MWFPIFIFIFASLLISFTFTAGLAISAAAVSLAFLGVCLAHYPEEKPGGIDNPESDRSIIIMMWVYAGISIAMIGASYASPAIKEYGAHSIVKF